MINVEKAPSWRVDWYVADWSSNDMILFRTKEQAVRCANKRFNGDKFHIVNVDWLTKNAKPTAVTSKFKVTDYRYIEPPKCWDCLDSGYIHDGYAFCECKRGQNVRRQSEISDYSN